MADGDLISITINNDTAAGGSEGAGFGGVIVLDNTGGTYSASATTSTTDVRVYRNLPAIRKWHSDDTHWQPIKAFGTPVVNGSTLEVPFSLHVPLDSDLTVKVSAPVGWVTEGGNDAAAFTLQTATNNSNRTIDRRYANVRSATFKGNPYVDFVGLNTAGGLNFYETTVVERQVIRVDVRNFTASTGNPWHDVEYRWTFEESNTVSPSLSNDAHWSTPSWAMTFEDKATGNTKNQATDIIGPMASFDVLSNGGPGNQIRVTCTPIIHNNGTLTTQTPVQAAVTITPLTQTTRQCFSPNGDNNNDGRDLRGFGSQSPTDNSDTFTFANATTKITAVSGTPFSGLTLYGDEQDDVHFTTAPAGQGTAQVYWDADQPWTVGSVSSLTNLGSASSSITLDSSKNVSSAYQVDRALGLDPKATIDVTPATTALTVVFVARNNNNVDVYLEAFNSADSNNPAWQAWSDNANGFRIYDTGGTQYHADWSASATNGGNMKIYVARFDGANVSTRFNGGAETFSTAAAVTLRTYDKIRIGERAGGASPTSVAYWHFLGVWNSYLSDADIENIEAILADRIGDVTLPGGHNLSGVDVSSGYRRLSALDSSTVATLSSGWGTDVEVRPSSGPNLNEDVATLNNASADDFSFLVDGDITYTSNDFGLKNSVTIATNRRRILGLGDEFPIISSDGITAPQLSIQLAASSLDRQNESIEKIVVDGGGGGVTVLWGDAFSTGSVINNGLRNVQIRNYDSTQISIGGIGGFFSKLSVDRTAATSQGRQQVLMGGEWQTLTDMNVSGYADEGVLAHALYPSGADYAQFRGLHFDECHPGCNYSLNWDAGASGTDGVPATKVPSPYKILSNSRLGNGTNGLDLSAQSNTRHEDGGDDNPHQFVVVEDNVIGPVTQYGSLYYVCDDVTFRRNVIYGCGLGAINNSDTLGTLYAYDNDIWLDSTNTAGRCFTISSSSNTKPHRIQGNRIRLDATSPSRVLECSFTAMATSISNGGVIDRNLVYVPNDTTGGRIIHDRDGGTNHTVAEFEAAVGLSGGTSFIIVDSEEELGWVDSSVLNFAITPPVYANNTPTLDAFIGGSGFAVRFTDPVIFAEIDTSWLTTLYNGTTLGNLTLSGSGTDRLYAELDFILQPGATLAVSWDGSSIQDDISDLFLGATTLNATLGTLVFGTQNTTAEKVARFRNPSKAGLKNTNSGPLFLDTFTPVSTGYFVAATGATHAYRPADYGATGARFCVIQVLTSDADVVFTTGISGSISDPHSGSPRLGRTYGMSFIQLPVDSTSEVRVMADPVAGITCLYTINFVD